MKYFAYGSNMCSGRLRARVTCSFITTAKLVGYQLRFHKVSRDGSSKCDAFRTDHQNDAIWGVVFDIPDAEKAALDRHEGRGNGYDDIMIMVEAKDGGRMKVITYIAATDAIREGLAPYTWYKAFVEAGAREHDLPQDYVAKAIMHVVPVQDRDQGRHETESRKLPR